MARSRNSPTMMMVPTMMAAINTQPQMIGQTVGVLAARHRSMATMTNARDQAFPAPRRSPAYIAGITGSEIGLLSI